MHQDFAKGSRRIADDDQIHTPKSLISNKGHGTDFICAQPSGAVLIGYGRCPAKRREHKQEEKDECASSRKSVRQVDVLFLLVVLPGMTPHFRQSAGDKEQCRVRTSYPLSGTVPDSLKSKALWSSGVLWWHRYPYAAAHAAIVGSN